MYKSSFMFDTYIEKKTLQMYQDTQIIKINFTHLCSCFQCGC